MARLAPPRWFYPFPPLKLRLTPRRVTLLKLTDAKETGIQLTKAATCVMPGLVSVTATFTEILQITFVEKVVG